MSSAFVPTIKELAAHVTISQAEMLLEQAQHQKTEGKIHKMLTAELLRIAPNLEPVLIQ